MFSLKIHLSKNVMLCRILPWQWCPSPTYPGLQEQLNDPLVFAQVALSLLQLWIFAEHSSMSEMTSNDRWKKWRGKGKGFNIHAPCEIIMQRLQHQLIQLDITKSISDKIIVRRRKHLFFLRILENIKRTNIQIYQTAKKKKKLSSSSIIWYHDIRSPQILQPFSMFSSRLVFILAHWYCKTLHSK